MTIPAAAALLAWLWLALLHGHFWQRGPCLPRARPRAAPPVAIIVPARDEAATVGPVVASLLAQDYEGPFRVILVDDNSTDATAALARAVADPQGRLTVLTGAARPEGWAGKLWAVHQGTLASAEDLVFLTDADIVHAPSHLATLVAGMESTGAAMVSEMVALRCASLAERALVPAFVYFFAMLYPFSRVNTPRSPVAAAAGGSVLLRRDVLGRVGGIAAIKGALIDDVALARAVKRHAPIWLGHTAEARSIRPYPHFADMWRMIARSAYVQLRHSPVRLVGCVLGMAVLFLMPVVSLFLGMNLFYATWFLMSGTFLPALARAGRSGFWVLALPLIALFYVAATIGAAIDHHRGRGVIWKNRAYPGAHP